MKSFNFFKKIICLAVVMATLLLSVASCGGLGKPLLKLEDASLSVNLFELYLSRTKGTLCSADYFGPTAKDSGFWETWIDVYEKKTYNTHYTELVLDNAKSYLAAVAEFDKLGLKLPQSYIDEIDTKLQEMIDNDANGSKTAFNAILAEYGANYEILREAYIIEAKIAYLREELFGKNGSKIGANIIDDYYKENYVRFRQIFFFTTKPVYETDANGDVIYYSDLSAKKIAYDSNREGAKKMTDAQGAVVKDSNGSIIWVYEKDGVEHVSYDSKGTSDLPTYPNPILDESGNVVTTKLDKTEMIALSDKVQTIMEDEAREGEYSLFDRLVEEYGEDEGMVKYPNGYYMTRTSDYDSPEVIEALFDMDTGEIRRVESEYGIHIVMKYELDKGGYADKDNKDFFVTEDGTYSFVNLLKSDLLEEYLKQYKESIVIDEERLKALSMKSVGANYNY